MGIGKIIPGVSGAMLAINLGIYEKLLSAITNFFDDVVINSKFLFVFSLGVISSIILGSNIIIYIFDNYKFVTLLFFLGLIIGGTYNFIKSFKFVLKDIILIIGIVTVFLFIALINKLYCITFTDNLGLFIAGYIETFASIIPGISATSLLLILGMYDKVLYMVSNVYDLSFVFNHIWEYFLYGLGMFLSFIINIYLINYALKKHRHITRICILGLSIGCIITLLIIICKLRYTFTSLIIGILLFIIGMFLTTILK